MIQQQRFGGTLIGSFRGVLRNFGLSGGLFRGLLPCFARDAVYVTGLLGVTHVVQRYLEKEFGLNQTQASLYASFAGGIFAAVPSHPLDVVKTCLQGDLERKTFVSPMTTARFLWRQGGIRRLYSGVLWRTLNITATVYVANECQNFFVKYCV
jgi:solute carrier family 25 carnitine/acylcarnitine transporter 20/29